MKLVRRSQRLALFFGFLVYLISFGCSGTQEVTSDEELYQESGEQLQTELDQTSQETENQISNSEYDDEEIEEMEYQNENGTEEEYAESEEENFNNNNTNEIEALIDNQDSVNDESTMDSNSIGSQIESTNQFESPVSEKMHGSGSLPEYGSKMHYIVQRGETLSLIAKNIYGNMEMWREMASLTGMENPNRIYPGDVVYYQLSDETESFASAYESVKRDELVIGAGDTLSKIAKNVFGDQGQWKSIWRQNDQISNPDKLEIGQVIFFVSTDAVMAEKQKIESGRSLEKEDHLTVTDSFTSRVNVEG